MTPRLSQMALHWASSSLVSVCIDSGHHNVGTYCGAFLGEVEHCLERLITETAANQFVVNGRHSVCSELMEMVSISPLKSGAMSRPLTRLPRTVVGIDTEYRFVVCFFKIAANFQEAHRYVSVGSPNRRKTRSSKEVHVKVGELGDNLHHIPVLTG